MQVGKNAVVTIDYALTDATPGGSGQVIGKDTMLYWHGMGNLFAALERVLEGKKAGDKVQATLTPAEGFGVRDEKLVRVVPRSAFQGGQVAVGSQFRTPSGPGGQMQMVTVTKIEGDNVTVDGNHGLADKTVTFDITIKDVRAATKEEIAHGHIHGPGHHHH